MGWRTKGAARWAERTVPAVMTWATRIRSGQSSGSLSRAGGFGRDDAAAANEHDGGIGAGPLSACAVSAAFGAR